MSYGEQATTPGVVLWERTTPNPEATRILPDGCLDIVWNGRRLFVAGPDSTARIHHSLPGESYTALRFAAGTGPALLGVPADELRDHTPDLDALWPARAARALTERVAASPANALRSLLDNEPALREADPLGTKLLAMVASGRTVATIAADLGIGSRQLRRRCLHLFGYGPRRLSRVVRLNAMLEQARSGTPLAELAACCGYADQAHLSREVRDLTATTPNSLLRELAIR